ncbi:hypothetical protein QUF70_12220 [Desulfobacterales bacterium HSG17]|nr:hypothetical protein [Desulfobacterales bacterium HSG17]
MENITITDIPQKVSYVLTKIQAGEPISVTFKGKKIAKLVPPDYSKLTARKKLEQLRKTAFVGDIVSPLDEKWKL